MKTSFLTIALLFVAIWCNAKVLTVSNNVNYPAMYDTFQAAHDAASYGDTLYVLGSDKSYGDVDVKKKLTIIGSGYHYSNEKGFPTSFGYIKLTCLKDQFDNIIANCSGTFIQSINCTGINYDYINKISISDIDVSRCYIKYIEPSNNLYSSIFHQNIIYYFGRGGVPISWSDCTVPTNLIIQNNIINTLGWINSPSVTVSNNLFIYTGINWPAISMLSKVNFYNNVFYGLEVFSSGTTCTFQNCTFLNNITIGNNNTNFFENSCNNSGSHNLINTDPLLLNVPKTKFDYSYDFRLKSNSPAINAGTDGTDIGITGGAFPWPKNEDGTLDFTGKSNIPLIVNMNILNSVVPVDGILKVNVAIKSQK